MLNLMNLLRHELITRLRGDERGVVYVEYALLITLIALVIVGGATALGLNLNILFINLADRVGNLVASP